MNIAISRYYLFEFFISCAFFSPVILLFWQKNGLGFTQIMVLQSVFAVTATLLELPTGAFADRIGKKVSLMIGAFLFSIGCIWYGMSHSFWQFFVGELVCGIGISFVSGTDRAYLHQILLRGNREADFSHIEGKARGFVQIAQAISSILGGILATVSLGFTLIATGIVSFLGFFVGSTFPKIDQNEKTSTKPRFLTILIESINLLQQNKTLLWYSLFFACFNALIWPMQLFGQAYLLYLHVPVYLFGIVFMVFNIVAGICFVLTKKFETITGDKVFIVLAVSVVIALYMLGRFPSIYTFPFWLSFIVFGIFSQTIISARVLKIVPKERTATVLSFQNMLRRVIYAIVGPLFGFASDTFGLPNALQMHAILTIIILGGLLLFPQMKKYE